MKKIAVMAVLLWAGVSASSFAFFDGFETIGSLQAFGKEPVVDRDAEDMRQRDGALAPGMRVRRLRAVPARGGAFIGIHDFTRPLDRLRFDGEGGTAVAGACGVAGDAAWSPGIHAGYADVIGCGHSLYSLTVYWSWRRMLQNPWEHVSGEPLYGWRDLRAYSDEETGDWPGGCASVPASCGAAQDHFIVSSCNGNGFADGDGDFPGGKVPLQGKAVPVPEPASLLLFGSGIAGMIAFSRKKRAA